MLSRPATACPECGCYWFDGEEPAKCKDDRHARQRFDWHVHRSVLELPGGINVVGVSFDAVDPYGRESKPDFGLYLDPIWQPPWPHRHLAWPDFGVPLDRDVVALALEDVRHRAAAGQRVEVGCIGGHGRTGTALACLAVLGGQPPGEAVSWVRANYCDRAVEAPIQAEFVLQF